MATNYAYEFKGVVYKVCDIQERETAKGVFRSRTLQVQRAYRDEWTGEVRWVNYGEFEFTQDNMAQLDGLKEGDKVTVGFNVNGRLGTDKQGKECLFVRLGGVKVEKIEG